MNTLIGKSSILEALDLFFNEGKNKWEVSEINVDGYNEGQKNMSIKVEFEDLPDSIVIDETNTTNLADEYLLTSNGTLLIEKEFNEAGKCKIYIIANHPSNSNCCNLLQKKNSELRNIIDTINPSDSVDRTRNASMRKAIWNNYSHSLLLTETRLELGKEDCKNIWDKLSQFMPIYSLFKVDRTNNDSDREVQDPLKEAVKILMTDTDIKNHCLAIAQKVNTVLQEVANKTVDKIREMDESLAQTLSPSIPKAESLKWADIFKGVSITGENGIPLNKRGSGIKRLVLLNFFRAQVEQTLVNNTATGIIYAIEEPETSQHYKNQELIIKAFKDLAAHDNIQVIITTHHPSIVKLLDFTNLRIIGIKDDTKIISVPSRNCMPYPSLNEINYIAFGIPTEELHNELYGYMDNVNNLSTGNTLLKDYKSSQPKIQYIKVRNDNSMQTIDISKTEMIRHQIHHPENTHNSRFTTLELKDSIDRMMAYIIANSES